MTLTVSFAPGTLTEGTGIRVYLDTDENASTGRAVYFRDPDPIGADYVIGGLQPHDAARASLSRYTGPTQQVFQTVLDVTSPAQDQRRIEVPLARLGNDDGRLKFRIECYQVQWVKQDGARSTQMTVQGIDLMPDSGTPPGVVQ